MTLAVSSSLTTMSDQTSQSPTPLVLSAEPWAAPSVIDVPTGIRVVELAHRDVTFGDLPDIFDAGFSVLATLGPIGPGYARYDGDVSETTSFDLTIGFPVADGSGDLPPGVTLGSFPAGSMCAASHLGSFEALPDAWEALMADLPGTPGAFVVEIYVTDPTTVTPDQLRTDLLVPLV